MVPAFDDLFSEDNLAQKGHVIVVYFAYAKYTNLIGSSTGSVDLRYSTKDPPGCSYLQSNH